MAFGLGVLRLKSVDFWAMTPRELRSASWGVFGRQSDVSQAAAFTSLMNQFPDKGVSDDTKC